MFSLNVLCAICKAAFKNDDTIYSTPCGHVLHLSCMNQCKSAICPICRYPNSNPHRIYIHFENEHDYKNVVNNLKAKLESYEVTNKKLQDELDKKVKEKDSVKRLYNISEQWRADLENKIQNLIQQRQQQNDKHSKLITEHSEEIKILKTYIDVLEKENVVEELNEKYKQLLSENAELRKNHEESETLKIKLNQKIDMQELRLKHITLELTKQFDERLEIDSKSESLDNDEAKSRKYRKKSGKNVQSKAAKNVSIENLNSGILHSIEGDSSELTQSKNCKVLILDFPRGNLVYPLKDTIILLASKMAITLTHENILYANIIPPKKNGHVFNTVFIVTEFTNIETKMHFLKFKNRLKFDSTTKAIKIKEYIDGDSYQLFMYANRRLRNIGYGYIACKDNKVIAKKKLCDAEEIVIKDQNHVDALLRCQTPSAADLLNSSALSQMVLF